MAATVAPANIWECPNLVPFGDRWVLIVSLWHHADDPFHLDGVRYLVGDLTVGPDGPRFAPVSGGRLDDGPCFYAPQVLRHGGRTLIWAWSWEHGRSADEIARAGWAGSLTFCRELTLVDDVLVSRPVVELDSLRGEPIDVRAGEAFAAAAFDCAVPADAGRLTLLLVDDGRERTGGGTGPLAGAGEPAPRPGRRFDGGGLRRRSGAVHHPRLSDADQPVGHPPRSTGSVAGVAPGVTGSSRCRNQATNRRASRCCAGVSGGPG